MDDNTASVGGVTTAGTPGPAASPAATPSTPDLASAAVPTPGTASEAPIGTDSDPSSATEARGPIPYDRFSQVNTRMREAERRIKAWEDSHGDLLKMPSDQAKLLRQFATEFQTDPVATVLKMTERLQGHPSFGPQLASAAARMLSARRGQGQAPAEPEPQPDIQVVDANGMPTGQVTFSASQLRKWQDWSSRQMEARIAQRIAPLEAQAQAQTRQQQEQQRHAEVMAQADALLERARSWNGFTDHEASILTAFQEHTDWDLKDAYLHVLHTEILPKLPAQAQAKVAADLQSKAAASTLNPSGGAPTSRPDFGGDFKKALEWASKTNR